MPCVETETGVGEVNSCVIVLTEEEEEASESRRELSCWSPPPDHTHSK